MPQTSRRKTPLSERMKGMRQSTNIEDRRGEKMVVTDESDKYPIIYPWPPPMSEDINDPLTTYSLGSHIPIWQAQRDLDTGRRAARDWLAQRPTRRKRGL